MANIVREPCDEGIIRASKAAAGCTETQGRWILAATILASSMAFIDGTVVNVALPSLQKNLNATVIDVQWVVEAYSLFLSALLLVGGSLGDRYGRRLVFVIGIMIFAAASAVCGVAASVNQLIVARAVQGIGAALLVPGSLAIISSSFEANVRGKAIGTWSGFSAMTTAIGPVLGGWLIENVSWRAVFFINLPIAAAVVVISFWRVPESRDKSEHGPLDWVGAALATIGLGGIVYGLIESSRRGFLQPAVLLSLVGGSVSLTVFVFNESRTQNPMLPLSLFRSRNFAGANLLTLLLYAALSGTFFFFTLNLIQVQGYTATEAGATLLPFVLIMFALSRWAGGLLDRFGARLPLIVGPVIAAAGFALFALPGLGAHYWTNYFPAVVVLGLGMAVSVAPLTTTVMTAVGEEKSGIASGINNAVARTAGLLAIAIFGVVMLHTFSSTLAKKLGEIQVSEDIRHLLSEQRVKLAGMEVPSNLTAEERSQVEQAVANSFLAGFRLIMFAATALSLGSALSSYLMISPKKGIERGMHTS